MVDSRGASCSNQSSTGRAINRADPSRLSSPSGGLATDFRRTRCGTFQRIAIAAAMESLVTAHVSGRVISPAPENSVSSPRASRTGITPRETAAHADGQSAAISAIVPGVEFEFARSESSRFSRSQTSRAVRLSESTASQCAVGSSRPNISDQSRTALAAAPPPAIRATGSFNSASCSRSRIARSGRSSRLPPTLTILRGPKPPDGRPLVSLS